MKFPVANQSSFLKNFYSLLNNCNMKKIFLVMMMLTVVFISCKKDSGSSQDLNSPQTAAKELQGHLKQTKTYSANVAIQWLNMQLNMIRVPLAAGAVSEAADRCLAYCGIALYESVVGGMPSYQSLDGQLNQFSGLPKTEPGLAYHWAASANAALAYMNLHLFPNASAANISAMHNLEAALEAQYADEVDVTTLQRSIEFGRAVAQIVYNYALSDGTSTMPAPGTYVLPVGPGLWEKTPPNLAGPVNPFAGQRRIMVPGSYEGATPAPPPAYSTVPGSAFYEMAKEVYDRSLTLTHDDTATALYHRDAPGYPGGGSLVAFLSQIFQQANCSLDLAALAYAKVGIADNDALRFCFVQKYAVNLVRPITYIRNVLGHSTWNALFPTPGHPEFPSAHSTNGGLITVMLNSVFGENFSFRLNHYDYLNLPARNYASFEALGREMSNSRPLGGIHYQASCDKGFLMGEKIATNILGIVKFLKE
jgi:hypothetical protein